MNEDTGTDLETIPDNLPAVEREIERVEEAMADTYTYARSPRVQARATALYQAAERLKADAGATAAGAQAPADQAATLTPDETTTTVANIAASGTVGEAWAEELGTGPNAANALQVGEDQRLALLSDMGDSAADVAASFDVLHSNIRMAVARELTMTGTPSQPEASREEMETFLRTDHGALLADDWGGEGPRKVGRALYRWQRMTALLTDAEDAALHDYFWAMSAQERAAILQRLAA